ncbi:MAG: hypothetical protein GXN99_01910 [Candidatus Nanohaloarchaeota archaeon]|nr:hypothetical protein [Candidatus Nanohaloarchaeota archaeon]
MMDEKSLINQDRSIIVACDVLEVEQYEKIVRETHTHPVIGGYKIGFSLALKYGLPAIVELTRSYTNKPIIYDHQKAGTDIPYTGKLFMAVMREAGIDSVILFPLTGPKTLEEWIKAAHANDLHVIVGGLMTHHQFLSNEGCYICEGDKGVYAIYKQAAELGIKDFVVPGNKPGEVKKIRNLLSAYVSEQCFILQA